LIVVQLKVKEKVVGKVGFGGLMLQKTDLREIRRREEIVERARELGRILYDDFVIMDPGKMSELKVADLLSDGKRWKWGELRYGTGLSTRSLSRTLERLGKERQVERCSKLVGNAEYVLSNQGLATAGSYLRQSREHLASVLKYCKASDPSETEVRVILGRMHSSLDQWLQHVLEGDPNVPLVNAAILMGFWGYAKALCWKGWRSEAVDVLKHTPAPTQEVMSESPATT